MRCTVVSAQAHASGEDQFRVREQTRYVYHGAVFETNREILVGIISEPQPRLVSVPPMVGRCRAG